MVRQIIETVNYPCQPCHTYVTYDGNKPKWEFGIIYTCNTLIWQTDYIIPSGFYSDGASIPKALRFLFDPFAKDVLSSAVVHDYLLKQWHEGQGYEYGIEKRSDCDRVFYHVMTIHKVNLIKKYCLYAGTRLYTLWLGER